MLETYYEHTVMAPVDGLVFDIGCGEFRFAAAMLDAGARRVVAVDPSPVPCGVADNDRVIVRTLAVVGRPTRKSLDTFIEFDDRKCSTLCAYGSADIPSRQRMSRLVQTITLWQLVVDHGYPSIIKLDIEGAESEVLAYWPGPIADQVTIEFHDHTTGVDNTMLPDAFLRWYHPIQHQRYRRRGRLSHWNSLFVLRELPKC